MKHPNKTKTSVFDLGNNIAPCLETKQSAFVLGFCTKKSVERSELDVHFHAFNLNFVTFPFRQTELVIKQKSNQSHGGFQLTTSEILGGVPRRELPETSFEKMLTNRDNTDPDEGSSRLTGDPEAEQIMALPKGKRVNRAFYQNCKKPQLFVLCGFENFN